MRKSIIIDKGKLGEIKYKASPLRQILGLPISAENQILLLNFFSHKETWQLSLNSIANHSFGKKKNRNRVKKSLEELEVLGLITIATDTYCPNLDGIQSQYLKQQEVKKTNKKQLPSVPSITDTLSTNVTQSNTTTDTLSAILPDTQSTIILIPTVSPELIPTVSTIEMKHKEEKLKEDKIINETIESNLGNISSLYDLSQYIPEYISITYKRDFIEYYKEFCKINNNTTITIQQLEEFQVFCYYVEQIKNGLTLVDNQHFNRLFKQDGVYDFKLTTLEKDVKKDSYQEFKLAVLPKLVK